MTTSGTFVTSGRQTDDSLDQLLGDCRRMAPHWKVPARAVPESVPPSLPHGITVPPASAHVVEGMAEYYL